MNQASWERIGAYTGIVFVAILVATFFTVPQLPFVSDSTGEIVSYFSDNQDGVLLTAFLGGAAAVAFLWFAGTLLSHFRTAEGGTGRVSVIAFSGAIAAAPLFTAASAMQGALALSIEESPPVLVRSMFSVGYMLSAFAEMIFLVWIVAVVLVIFRTGALPAWLGWLGALNALLGVYGTFDIFSEGVRDSLEGPFGLVSFLVFLVWILLVAVMLTMRIGTSERQTPSMG